MIRWYKGPIPKTTAALHFPICVNLNLKSISPRKEAFTRARLILQDAAAPTVGARLVRNFRGYISTPENDVKWIRCLHRRSIYEF